LSTWKYALRCSAGVAK